MIANVAAFGLLDRCVQVAKDCSRDATMSGRTGVEDRNVALRVGFRVRLEIAVDIAVRLVERDLGPGAREVARIALSQVVVRYGQMVRGLVAAKDEPYAASLLAPKLASERVAAQPRDPPGVRSPTRRLLDKPRP